MSKTLCTEYLDALNESDLEKVLSLFTKDAVVHSPLYGEMDAVSFYQDLFADTERSDTTLLNVFDSAENGNAIGLHFQYVWTLKSEEVVKFEVVDVFELSEDKSQFTKLTIIYDTYKIREEHSNSQKLSNKG